MRILSTASIIIFLSFTGSAFAGDYVLENRVNPEYENFHQFQNALAFTTNDPAKPRIQAIDNGVNPEYENFYQYENASASSLGSQPEIGSDDQARVISLEEDFFYLGYENMSF
jgi:hypothetical protein